MKVSIEQLATFSGGSEAARFLALASSRPAWGTCSRSCSGASGRPSAGGGGFLYYYYFFLGGGHFSSFPVFPFVFVFWGHVFLVFRFLLLLFVWGGGGTFFLLSSFLFLSFLLGVGGDLFLVLRFLLFFFVRGRGHVFLVFQFFLLFFVFLVDVFLVFRFFLLLFFWGRGVAQGEVSGQRLPVCGLPFDLIGASAKLQHAAGPMSRTLG